jgi:GT2 family glycosyltransferase
VASRTDPVERPLPNDADHADVDVTVVIVSHRSERWLETCLRSLAAHSGDASLDVVVVENGATRSSAAVSRSFGARWIGTENHGFAHANNVGLRQSGARYVLFLNPDTEFVQGTLDVLIRLFERDPRLGLVGVRQLGTDGRLEYTIRRFASALRWLGEALASESWPMRSSVFGERELADGAYADARRCDWTAGSFMLARREALLTVGGMSERYFLYCEEPDLCLRLKRAGWNVQHRPEVTIVHHGGNEASDPRHAAQLASSRKLYARTHFGRIEYPIAVAMLIGGYALRAVFASSAKRSRARMALGTVLGLRPAPFG